jgi:KDO2-lipid IV(A) lauroyltransferase
MKRIRHLYIYGILRFFIFFFAIIPRSCALFLGNLLGIVVFRLSKEARRVAYKNVAYLYPSVEYNGRRRRLVVNNFKKIGRNLVDALRLIRYRNGSLEEIVSIKNGNAINDLLERGKGLIVITAHLGCWELIPAYFSEVGYRVNVMAREVYDKNVNREINRIREMYDIRIIDKRRAPIIALKCLLRGEAVGILMDQRSNKNSVSIDFMGRKAKTPIGPAYLAMKTGSPVVPVAIHRLRDDTHMIEVGNEVEIARTGKDEDDLFENTRRCSKAVEQFITNHLDEWVWFHKRWG